jgi:H+/Cl- antiporter ClcA
MTSSPEQPASFRWILREQMLLGMFVVKWAIIATPMAIITGSMVALFLWSLDRATATRWAHPWLLFLLPVAGLAIGAAYQWLGREVEAGNNLIIDNIHEPGGGIPTRMAPLILISTVITHLFGGSAGREGTAVQMGGSIAGTFARWLQWKHVSVRILLMTGIAAGFGAVFGTPLAGAVFAMEVLVVGQMRYDALIPCLIASIVADQTCRTWGIAHTNYFLQLDIPQLDWLLLMKVALASIAFGFASVLFAETTHTVGRIFKRYIRVPITRPFIGGLIVIALVYLCGSRDYLGLGVVANSPDGVSIMSAFQPDGARTWSWAWKILFTAVTLGSGFKGGEVTPLFFVGATLGNVMGRVMHVPAESFELFPALGFVAVFSGATNAPLACTLMGIELFGGGQVIYLATACFLAYLFSGHSGIYLAQRLGTPKWEDSQRPSI